MVLRQSQEMTISQFCIYISLTIQKHWETEKDHQSTHYFQQNYTNENQANHKLKINGNDNVQATRTIFFFKGEGLSNM